MMNNRRRVKVTSRFFLVVLTVTCGISRGQESAKAISSLYGVHEGMPEEQVLSGLSEQYKLTKMKTSVASSDLWSVQSKQSPNERGEITFYNGKTLMIIIDKFSSQSPDAVQFAKKLQAALHEAGDVPKNLVPNSPQEKLWKLTNGRSGAAEVQTQIVQGNNLDQLLFFISMGGSEFRVQITTFPGNPTSVEFSEIRR
jgi:hypothetical protein